MKGNVMWLDCGTKAKDIKGRQLSDGYIRIAFDKLIFDMTQSQARKVMNELKRLF